MGQEGQRAGSGLARKTGNRGIFFRGWQREANGGEQLGGRGRGRWMSKEEIENQKRPSKYGHGGFLIHFPRGIVLHAFIWSFSSFSLVAWVFYCFVFSCYLLRVFISEINPDTDSCYAIDWGICLSRNEMGSYVLFLCLWVYHVANVQFEVAISALSDAPILISLPTRGIRMSPCRWPRLRQRRLAVRWTRSHRRVSPTSTPTLRSKLEGKPGTRSSTSCTWSLSYVQFGVALVVVSFFAAPTVDCLLCFHPICHYSRWLRRWFSKLVFLGRKTCSRSRSAITDTGRR